MKKITNILLSVVIFGFVGCTSDTKPSYPELPNDNSVIPKELDGFGLEYDVTGYFFPYNTLRDGSTYKDYVITTKDANGYFDNQQRVIKHYIEGNKNAYDESIITVFQDNKVVKKSTVGDKITDITYDIDGNEKTKEQYFRLLQVNDDLIRNENAACVLKKKLENFYIGDVIPVQADPHENPVSYSSVLRFYCGTRNGSKIDRYYADGWGEIIEIYRYSDTSVQYVVFDRQTDQSK